MPSADEGAEYMKLSHTPTVGMYNGTASPS